jgi:hypothetical protein
MFGADEDEYKLGTAALVNYLLSSTPLNDPTDVSVNCAHGCP